MKTPASLIVCVLIAVIFHGVAANIFSRIFKRSYCDTGSFSIFCSAPTTTPAPPPPAQQSAPQTSYCDADSIFAIFCPVAETTTPPPTSPPPPAPPTDYCLNPAFCVFCQNCQTATTTAEATTTAMETTTVMATTTAMDATTEMATTTAMPTTTTEMATTTQMDATPEPTTTVEPTTTTVEPTTTAEPTTTTVEPTTTTVEATTTEMATTTTATPTTTTPQKLCPAPSVTLRFKRVIGGSATASCDAPGLVELFHPGAKLVLCTGVLIDATTVQIPSSCAEIVKFPNVTPELEIKIGDSGSNQAGAVASVAEGNIPGTSLVTVKTPFDVTVCPGLPCMYDKSMDGLIDFTKCTAAGFGTIKEIVGGSASEYSGLNTFPIDSIDTTSCTVPTGLELVSSCATSSTGSPCTGDGGAAITCEATTGEKVIVGQVEEFPCGSPPSFAFLDFTKA